MTAHSTIGPFDARARGRLLALALAIDAAVSGATGAVYIALAEPLEDLLGIPPSLLRPVGAFLVFFGAIVGFMAARSPVPRAAVVMIVAANTLWVLGSILYAALAASPTAAGTAWTLMQAAAVAAFAAAQRTALPAAGANAGPQAGRP